MYYEVTTNLALDGGIDGPEVSQPIELGTDNAILVQIAIVSGYVWASRLHHVRPNARFQLACRFWTRPMVSGALDLSMSFESRMLPK